MLLTVDIGNTTVGLCALTPQAEDYAVVFSARLDTVRQKSPADYLAQLRALLERAGIDPTALQGVAVSSVVPCLNETMRTCLRALTGREAVWITAHSRTGLTYDVPEPERVGLDRIADAAWAAAHYPLPVVTVDMGTATTLNVVGEGGVFLGGIIAPGLNTALQALYTHADQLPEIDLCAPVHLIGRDTPSCMRSGALYGSAAMLDALTARIEAELGRPVTLVITGGMARHVAPLCTHPHSYDPHLLAKGLALLYTWNSGAGPAGPAGKPAAAP